MIKDICRHISRALNKFYICLYNTRKTDQYLNSNMISEHGEKFASNVLLIEMKDVNVRHCRNLPSFKEKRIYRAMGGLEQWYTFQRIVGPGKSSMTSNLRTLRPTLSISATSLEKLHTILGIQFILLIRNMFVSLVQSANVLTFTDIRFQQLP